MNRLMKIFIASIFVTLIICTQTMALDPNDLIAIRDASDVALNAHDLDTMMSYWADDVIYDYVPLPVPFVGKQAVRGFFEDLFVGFPDFGTTEGRILATDNIVVVEHSTVGTHLGDWMGIPATGNSSATPHIDIYEFEDDKIKKTTTYLDAASVMIQLGVMPAPDMPNLVPSFTPPDPEATGLSPMDADAELVARWNNHDAAQVAKMDSLDFEIFAGPLGAKLDRNAMTALNELYFAIFPDVRMEVVSRTDLGAGWVLTEMVNRATHQGPFMGIPASGYPIEIRAVWLTNYDEEGLVTKQSYYLDNLTLIHQMTEPPYTLEGTWITVAPTPMGNTIIKVTYIAQDTSKTQFTAQLEQINMYPILTELYPDGQKIKFAGGQLNKTGLNSYNATLLGYVTKDGGIQTEDIVGIFVITGTLTLIDQDSGVGQGSGAYYLASQDTDADGFPDEGEEPVLCIPWAYSKKRLTMMTPCVPTQQP